VIKAHCVKLIALKLVACFVLFAVVGCGDDQPKSDKKDSSKRSEKKKDGKSTKKKSKDTDKDSDKKRPKDGPKKKLVVAISPDIPPYVMKKATTGLEVDLVRNALPGYDLEFTQMPYEGLQTAVSKKKAEVSVGVQQEEDGGFYSKNFITFANFAISKRAQKFKIRSVGDLAEHDVLAWQDAYRELGPDFEKMFAPGGTDRKNYTEFASQREQVQKFWKSKRAVIVIDRAIFSHFTKELGYTTANATSHAIFPKVTNFKVAFQDEVVRDDFNDGLDQLCKSGDYKKLLAKYEVVLEWTVCGR